MRIVLINQYFPPDDAPTGLMLEEVADRLVEQGHDVTALCSKGGYSGNGWDHPDDGATSRAERTGHFRVVRIASTQFGRKTLVGKMIDYLIFSAGVVWKLLAMRPRPDRMVALSTPPTLSLLVRLASKLRGADHAHWVMDLYPDVMVSFGMISRGRLLERFLGLVIRFGFGGKRSRGVLTLGPDMDERLSTNLRPEVPRKWIPLWGSAGSLDRVEKEVVHSPPASESGTVLLMYSGNMGLGHRFGEFLEAACAADDRFQWRFSGRGRRRAEIEEFMKEHPDAPVSVGDYVPREQLAAHLASADVHLASLDDSWSGTMVPSKVPGIFATGRPVIFVGSPESSAGTWIRESGGGWVVESNDHEGMLEVLKEAANREVRLEKGQNALDYARQHFNRKKNSARVARFLTR